MRVSLVGRLASLASFGAMLVVWTSYVMCIHVVIGVCLWWGASRASLRSPRSAPCLFCGLHMLCVFMLLMRVSLVWRLASLAAFASFSALLVLWTSYVMCIHVVIDACVFGGAPREPRCARLARRPACIVDFICYVSSGSYWCVCLWCGASRASLRSPRSAPCLHCGLSMLCVRILLLTSVALVRLGYVVLCYVMIGCIIQCVGMQSFVVLWHTVLCRVVKCIASRWFVVLRRVMLCHNVL